MLFIFVKMINKHAPHVYNCKLVCGQLINWPQANLLINRYAICNQKK